MNLLIELRLPALVVAVTLAGFFNVLAHGLEGPSSKSSAVPLSVVAASGAMRAREASSDGKKTTTSPPMR